MQVIGFNLVTLSPLCLLFVLSVVAGAPGSHSGCVATASLAAQWESLDWDALVGLAVIASIALALQLEFP